MRAHLPGMLGLLVAGERLGFTPERVQEIAKADQRTCSPSGVVRCACGKVISPNKAKCLACACKEAE